MVTGAKLSASSRCVKYLMFIFNLLFVITGIILISIGSVILGVYHDYQHFLDSKFFSVPSLLIAVGSIIFFIAFFGCCGAVRENYCMLVTFTSLMVLVFILELSGGISGYVLGSHAESVVATKMHDSMAQYNSSKEISLVWDGMQEKFECCGTNSNKDWQAFFANDSVPMSCCKTKSGAIGVATCNINSPNIYPTGCLPAFLDFVYEHALQLGGVGIGIAFVQFLGIWFSVFLARSIKNSYETV